MSGFIHANVSQALGALWGDLIHSGGTLGGRHSCVYKDGKGVSI